MACGRERTKTWKRGRCTGAVSLIGTVAGLEYIRRWSWLNIFSCLLTFSHPTRKGITHSNSNQFRDKSNMKLSVVSAWFIAAAVLVSADAERNERQLFSSSRFSSSGLVFPGPPAQQAKQVLQQRAGNPGGPQQPQPSENLAGLGPSNNRPLLPQPAAQQRFQQGPNFQRPANGPRPPFIPGNQPVSKN